jgi:hypothetical protein
VRSATSAVALVAVGVLGACKPAEPTDDPALVPPVFGEPVIEPWLDAGHYKSWDCDAAPRDSAGLSPHGVVRTCTNPVAAAAAAGADWPVDSAFVMELYEPTGELRGRSVQRRSEPGGAGDSWYWYLNAGGALAADGWGFEGPARDDCSSCHVLAGTAGNPGHGFVF